jgi:hypothetical protein
VREREMANFNLTDYINLRIITSAFITAVGIVLLFVPIQYDPRTVLVPLILTFSGMFIITAPSKLKREAGAIVVGAGFYLLLRATNIINAPILRIGLGAFLMAIGIMYLTKNVQQEKRQDDYDNYFKSDAPKPHIN